MAGRFSRREVDVGPCERGHVAVAEARVAGDEAHERPAVAALARGRHDAGLLVGREGRVSLALGVPWAEIGPGVGDSRQRFREDPPDVRQVREMGLAGFGAEALRGERGGIRGCGRPVHVLDVAHDRALGLAPGHERGEVPGARPQRVRPRLPNGMLIEIPIMAPVVCGWKLYHTADGREGGGKNILFCACVCGYTCCILFALARKRAKRQTGETTDDNDRNEQLRSHILH